MNQALTRLLAVVAGVAVGGGTYAWLVADPVFAGTIGIIYAAVAWLTIAFGSDLPGEVYGDDWQAVRWNGAFGALVCGIAPLAVYAGLPIALETRFALALFVLGVGYTGLLLGVAMTRAKMAAEESPDETTETDTGRAGLSDTKGL